jgi:hypothetical protein
MQKYNLPKKNPTKKNPKKPKKPLKKPKYHNSLTNLKPKNIIFQKSSYKK